ncbi:ParA family protein [Metabacillus herbersteinensis]|uniref:ParA family protein n=1 Tax=Metabacillus herbersteinensis TaxID=283816 RepID=A0ABV6GJB5_9BACI
MIIGIVSYESKYKEIFQKEEQIETALVFDQVNKMLQATVNLDVILLDGKVVPYTELESIRDQFPMLPIFYKLYDVKSDVITKNIERFCSAYKVTPINEYYTTDQVASEVLRIIFDKAEYASKKVASFFGTHSGAGVSTTVLNLARAISDRVQGKVLVLSLNAWDPSDYFLEYNGSYLNDLKVDLKTQSLTPAKLSESLYQYKNFYHLAGNRDIKLQRYYRNEEIAHLIEVASEMFDLILIDGGTHFDTACAAQAFVSSNLKFVITSQEDKGYRGYFPHVFQQLIEPSGASRNDFMLVINKYQTNMSLINEKDLEAELEMQRIATLPDLEVLGPIAIRQKKLLYDLVEGGEYIKSIDALSNLIIANAKLREKPLSAASLENNRGFLSGIFSKKKQKEDGEKEW